MRIPKTAPLLLLAVSIMFSCQNRQKQDARQLIAEKMQYDVFIKNPNPDYDWWIENLPGPQREDLLEWIFDVAESGEMQVYDYFDKALSPEEVRNIGVDTIYQALMRTEPPFETYDTMITTSLEKRILRRSGSWKDGILTKRKMA
ncbi:MAG: hypothetical protein U5Q03_17215 [Bacteroidota bacterium]|nr:hypothetical protein [Bacteroidota bacterium]